MNGVIQRICISTKQFFLLIALKEVGSIGVSIRAGGSRTTQHTPNLVTAREPTANKLSAILSLAVFCFKTGYRWKHLDQRSFSARLKFIHSFILVALWSVPALNGTGLRQ
jgi:hypothetical protein